MIAVTVIDGDDTTVELFATLHSAQNAFIALGKMFQSLGNYDVGDLSRVLVSDPSEWFIKDDDLQVYASYTDAPSEVYIVNEDNDRPNHRRVWLTKDDVGFTVVANIREDGDEAEAYPSEYYVKGMEDTPREVDTVEESDACQAIIDQWLKQQ